LEPILMMARCTRYNIMW